MTIANARICVAALLLAASATVAHGQEGAIPPLDPSAPMAPLPGLGVDWPDLGQPDPIDATAPPATAVEADTEQRYAVVLEGLDGLPDTIRTRFAETSTLDQGDGKPANAAQIDRRAREDAELLRSLLRSEGYYDAVVTTAVAPRPDRVVAVTLTAEPGKQYKFAEVAVTGIANTGAQEPTVREAFPVDPGDPVDAGTVIAGQAALRDKLQRSGYPFAKVADPDVTIDHATTEGALALNVETGPLSRYGAIRVEGAKAPFGAKHVGVIARFEPGELYDQSEVDDLRRALIATGIVGSVRTEPVQAAPGVVDIVTTLEPAPLRTLAGEIGYGTGEGFRVEASWQHRNLIRPEGAVTFRGIAGTREQLLGSTLRMSNFRRRDQALNAALIASHRRYDAYDARTLSLSGGIERQSNILWQHKWTWSVGAELLASDERDFVPQLGRPDRRTYFIAALPGFLQYDGSDDLLDPRTGFRLSGRASPELSLQGGTFGYLRTQFDASTYVPISDRVTIAGRARLGTIFGAAQDNIAPSRLLYAGGGGSVRGYGYQSLGPRNAANEPTGGRGLIEFSLEARTRLPFFGGNFGIVPFIDAGQVASQTIPRFNDLQVGAGVGLRYYSLFGPIRIDVATPLNRRSGDPRVAVYVSLGQAF